MSTERETGYSRESIIKVSTIKHANPKIFIIGCYDSCVCTLKAYWAMVSMTSLKSTLEVSVCPWKIMGSPLSPSQQSSSTQRQPWCRALNTHKTHEFNHKQRAWTINIIRVFEIALCVVSHNTVAMFCTAAAVDQYISWGKGLDGKWALQISAELDNLSYINFYILYS